jgi:hypothetical protein
VCMFCFIVCICIFLCRIQKLTACVIVDRVCLSRIKMADNVSSLEGLHIDLSMEKILLEYPLECLPSKLNKRTGKALRCPYEAIQKCSKIASKIIAPRSLLPSTKLPGIFPVHYKQNLRVAITKAINIYEPKVFLIIPV